MFYTYAQFLSHERQTATSYDIFLKIREAVSSYKEYDALRNADVFKDHADMTQNIKTNSYKIEDLTKKISLYEEKLEYYNFIKNCTKDSLIDVKERCEINLFNNSMYNFYSKEQVDKEVGVLDYYTKLLSIKNKGKNYVEGCIKKFENLHKESMDKKQELESENQELQLEADKIKADMTPKKLEKLKNQVKDAEARYTGRPTFGYSKVFMLSNTLTGYFERFGHMKENPIIREFENHVSKSVSEFERKNPKPMDEYTRDIKMVKSFVESYANGRIAINENHEDIYKFEVEENQ